MQTRLPAQILGVSCVGRRAQKLGRKERWEVVLYTTDGPGTYFLKCGKFPGAYATIDFGPGYDPRKAFHQQRLYEPHGNIYLIRCYYFVLFLHVIYYYLKSNLDNFLPL